MDDSNWFEPQAIIYTKRRQTWDDTGTAIPNFEAAPPMPPKR